MASKGIGFNATVYAMDSATGLPETGDLANISLFVSKDGAAGIAATNAEFELSATNNKGQYGVLLTNTEADANKVEVSGVSTTSGIVIFPKEYSMDHAAEAKATTNFETIVANQNGIDDHLNFQDSVLGTPQDLGDGATLADNNRSMADNTGGTTFDSSTDSLAELQGQVVSGVPENEVATAQTLTLVGAVAGSYTDTETKNDVYLEVSPDGADPFDFYLTFQVEDKVLDSIVVNGRTLDGSGVRGTHVWAYDWQTDPSGVSASWQQISGSSTLITESGVDLDFPYPLLNKHRSATGEVRIRFTSLRSTATDTVFLDQVIVRAVASGLTAGEIADAVWLQGSPVFYSNAIHIDTVHGTAGTVVGENGTPTNPVDNIADAYTLSQALKFERFFISNGSQLILDRDYTGYTFAGTGYSLDLNDQEVAFTKIVGANLEGLATSAIPAPLQFEQCRTQATGVSLPPFSIIQSAIGDGIIATAAGTYTVDFCSSGVAGTGTPAFTFISNVNFNVRHYSGGLEIKAMNSTCNMSFEGDGHLIINANCTGGVISLKGNIEVTDNSGGLVTLSQVARSAFDQLTTSLADITDAVVGNLAELSVGKPIATPELKDAIMLIYMALRNKNTQDSDFRTIFNDAGTAIAKASTADAAGTLTVGEMVTP